MTQLILAALFFIALHVGVAGTSARGRAIEKLGENLYRAAFSLLSLLGIVWLAHAYRVCLASTILSGSATIILAGFS
jgi:uncharacterized membrane protein